MRKGLGIAMLAALFVAGCGGGGDSSTTSSPLSTQQFVKRAIAICEKGVGEKEAAVEQGLDKLASQGSEDPTAKDLEKLAEMALIPAYRKLTRELGELIPPGQDAKTVKEFVSDLESTLQAVEEDPGQVVSGEPFKKADKAMLAYGIRNCLL